MKRFFKWLFTLAPKSNCLRCGHKMYGSHFFYCDHCYDVLKRNHR